MARRVAQLVCAAFIVGAAAAPGTVAAAAASKDGEVKIWVTPTSTTTSPTHPGRVVLTGAIGDYGTTVEATATGTPKKAGTDTLFRLSKGTILINTSSLTTGGGTTAPSTANTTNCSFVGTVAGLVHITKGTGAYAGITGTITITGTFAAILRKKNGACGGKPLAFYGAVQGSGTVSL